MLRSYLLAVGFSAVSLGALAMGCGSTTNAATATATTGTSTGGGGTHAEPPPPGPMKAPDGMGSVTFAISKLYLGDTRRDGTPDKANAWKEYGYDLDGKISTKDSTDLCQPASGAKKENVYPDGNDGIDNSFGHNILGIILGLAMDAPTRINDTIKQGKFTIMLDLEKLGTAADYNPILTRLYGGSDLMAAPKFDGSDKWPVIPELLNNPTDIKSAKVQFPMSYSTSNTWVSGSKGDVVLSLSLQGTPVTLTIHNAVVSMQMDGSHKHATNGTVAGIISTDELTMTVKNAAGNFGICGDNNLIESVLGQIKQASDIMVDGTQDSTKTCDGISIGIGFDAELVQLGGIGPAAKPPMDPCAMGGGGAGGAGGG